MASGQEKESTRARSERAWPLGALGREPRAAKPRVAVLGLARSGRAAARLLQSRGVTLDLLDLARPRAPHDPEENRTIEAELGALERGGAALKIGPHDPAWLRSLDLVVKSPGIPPRIPFLAAAASEGVPVVGEVELAWLAARGPVLAITGTNGKSTTTAWAGDMATRAGARVEVCGNIGRPFSDAVLRDPEALFVVEVSSFQIQDSVTLRPAVATLLNFTPDHLDYHADIEEYRQAKLSMFDRLGPESAAVVGPDDSLARDAVRRGSARLLRFRLEDSGEEGAFLRGPALVLRMDGLETEIAAPERVSLPGPHNLENVLAAAASVAALGIGRDAIAASATGFKGLRHRLELVGTLGGVRFINDSKATNTDSLAVALRAFAEKVILIAGGRDKAQDFTPLAPAIRERVAALVLIGEGADRIAAAWSGVPVVRAGTLAEATRRALGLARPTGIVLLSPACASFDMFRNYEDRGDQFRDEVSRLIEEGGGDA